MQCPAIALSKSVSGNCCVKPEHERSSEHAIRMAEAWMAEAERRKAAGL